MKRMFDDVTWEVANVKVARMDVSDIVADALQKFVTDSVISFGLLTDHFIPGDPESVKFEGKLGLVLEDRVDAKYFHGGNAYLHIPLHEVLRRYLVELHKNAKISPLRPEEIERMSQTLNQLQEMVDQLNKEFRPKIKALEKKCADR